MAEIEKGLAKMGRSRTTMRHRRLWLMARRRERFIQTLCSFYLGSATVVANVVKGSDDQRRYLPSFMSLVIQTKRRRLRTEKVAKGIRL